jgi:hypothetical protein
MDGWLRALEDSGLAEAVRTSAWLYPTLQVGHLLAMAALVGLGAALDVRLLGWIRLPLRPLLDVTEPPLIAAAALAVVTGSLMFSAEATHLTGHPAFQAKVVLLALLLGNAVGFHLGARRTVTAWGDAARPPAAARLAGGVALVGWAAVVVAARLIAFI